MTPPAAGSVVVVGSANLDLVAVVDRLPGGGETVMARAYFEAEGGKGLNQAVASARAGAPTTFIGMVGTDGAGDRLRTALASAGVEVGGLGTTDAPTGRALIGVGPSGENAIVVVPGANAAVDPAHVQAHHEAIAGAAVVLGQQEIPEAALVAAFSLARAAGARTVLNPAPARPLPTHVATLVDVLVPNEHELAVIGGVSACLDAGIGTLVVTEGRRGARVVTEQGEQRISPFPVDPMDTTGAGDAFCGVLCARWAAGDQLTQALRWAAAAGALATTVAGAVPSMPDRAAIEELLTSAT